MARQYNKIQKRRRRGAYLDRLKQINKAPAVGSLRKKK